VPGLLAGPGQASDGKKLFLENTGRQICLVVQENPARLIIECCFFGFLIFLIFQIAAFNIRMD